MVARSILWCALDSISNFYYTGFSSRGRVNSLGLSAHPAAFSFVLDIYQNRFCVSTLLGSPAIVLAGGAASSLADEKNIDAGTAEITVSGIGGYTGTKTLNFVIQKAQLLDLMLQRTLYPYSFHSWTTYDPETDYVTAESIVQPKAYDYYIMGQDYVDAGTWNVTAYAKNASNYQGIAAASPRFSIQRRHPAGRMKTFSR